MYSIAIELVQLLHFRNIVLGASATHSHFYVHFIFFPKWAFACFVTIPKIKIKKSQQQQQQTRIYNRNGQLRFGCVSIDMQLTY